MKVCTTIQELIEELQKYSTGTPLEYPATIHTEERSGLFGPVEVVCIRFTEV